MPMWWKAVLLSLLFLAVSILVGVFSGVVLALAGGMVDDAGELTARGLQALPWVGAVAIAIASLAVFGAAQGGTLGHKSLGRPDRRTLHFLIPVAILVLGSTLTEGAALGLLPVNPDHYHELFDHMFRAPLWVSLLTVVLVPAVFEELAFRGAIQPKLVDAYGPMVGIVLTAGLFAFVHLNIYQIVAAFIAGLVYGYIRHVTRSLYPAMVAHGLGNLIVVLSWQSIEVDPTVQFGAGQLLSTGALGILLLGLGAFICWWLQRRQALSEKAFPDTSVVPTAEGSHGA